MKSIHILLVEDNEGDIRLTQEAFREGGIINNLSITRNGEEALDFILRRGRYNEVDPVDLILLDINLPLMNGDELLRIIKAEEAVKHIPVIMLTTSSSKQDIERAYRNHASCYITKPADIDEFMKVVRSLERFWVDTVQLP